MRNLFEDIERNASDKVAILFKDQSYSYREFLERVDSFAGYLLNHQVQVGDRVIVTKYSRLDVLVAAYGCFKIGATFVPVATEDPEQLDELKANTGARVVIADYPTGISRQCAVSTSPEAMIIFTSGTTNEGRKGVILGHEGIGSTADFMNRRMKVDQSVREFIYAPLDHAFGFGRCHAVLEAQGTLLLGGDALGYDVLFSALKNHQCNSLGIVPSVLASLLKLSAQRLVEAVKNVKWIQTGAMRFDKSFRERLCQLMPECNIFLHYGLSEAMRVTFFNLQECPDKLHTEGPAADGVEIGIFDDEGERVGVGMEGTIAVRGRSLALGYTNDVLWKKSFRDGWFFSSDKGKLDEEGFLVFLGRTDDVINANGIIVHPDEIESRLEQLFPDQAFSIVGVPVPKRIKDKVVVLCTEGPTSLQIGDLVKAFVKSEQYMAPAMICPVSTLPRTHTGKVLRSKLAQEMTERMGGKE